MRELMPPCFHRPSVTRFVYDLAGEPVAPALPDSSTRPSTYWPGCVSKTQVDGKNNTTSSAEDALGRAASVAGELTKNGATTQGYDAAGQLTTGVAGSTSTAYTFDARGDRTKATTGTTVATYGYDQVNRLTSYTRGTTTASYTYNGDSLRASKTVGGVTTKFVYDTAEGLPRILTDGASYYLYGPDGVPFEQVTTAGVVTYLHADQLGSIRMITSSTGTSVGTATYTAYGTRTTTGTTSAFGYAGQYTDTESGLQWLRARYYDPTTGQFLTVDPLTAATGARYAYAGGNPITGSDPSGLISVGLCVSGQAGLLLGGIAQVCFVVATDDRDGSFTAGFTETLGGGYQTPAAAVDGTVQVSTARNVGQLGGPFGYGGFAADEVVDAGVGGFGASNCDAPGGFVAGADVNLGVGVAAPVPAEIHAGVSNTWTQSSPSFNLWSWLG